MNLLIDESVDRQIVARLRQEGHEVSYVAEMEPGITFTVVSPGSIRIRQNPQL